MFRSRTAAVLSLALCGGAEGLSSAQLRANIAQRGPSENEGRLCIDDKLVPELYLLGAQKAATTEFSRALRFSGVLFPNGEQKEFHFFEDVLSVHNHSWQWDSAETQSYWYSRLPQCYEKGSKEDRVLMGDMSPGNLHYVPLPSGWNVGESNMWGASHTERLDLPNILHSFYGAASSRLSFVVLLREPISRWQSTWYHSRSNVLDPNNPARNGWPGCQHETFAEDIKEALQLMKQDPPTISSPLWTSLYARNMEPWLASFPAKQFIVTPMKYFVGETRRQVCDVVEQRLRIKMDCEVRGAGDSNHREHPSVDEDIAGELRQELDEWLEGENERLDHLLFKAYHEGATLPLLDESKFVSVHAVRTWIRDGW